MTKSKTANGQNQKLAIHLNIARFGGFCIYMRMLLRTRNNYLVHIWLRMRLVLESKKQDRSRDQVSFTVKYELNTYSSVIETTQNMEFSYYVAR